MLGLTLALVLATPPPIVAELVPAGERIDIMLALTLADPKAATAELKRENATGQPSLTAAELSDRYGQSPETYRRLQDWLTGAGFTLADTSGLGRLVLSASGSAAQVTKLFGVRLHRVKGQPPKIHAPDGKPRLPDWVQKAVVHLEGLDNRPGQAKPIKRPPR